MRSSHLAADAQEASRALLVGVVLPSQTKEEVHLNLEELSELSYTYGMEVVGTVVQKVERPSAATWLGKGKVAEVKERIEMEKITMVVFDDELTPAQVRNLERAWHCTVWDRNLLILGIFVMRARTAQAKTQVMLAQYEYLLPRLVGMWTHHSRQKGGTGMKGPGEKELETDKRLIQKKIVLLKKKLEAIERQGAVQRKARSQQVKVALVGYTNAGKSTLMRCLSKADVFAEDRLFATLNTTVRKVVLQQIPFLLSDTVGFIRKLPHTLIESFKSTLAEVKEADLLLHVVDASYPHCQEHIKVVLDTLAEIGADKIPSILILNKTDKIAPKDDVEPSDTYASLKEQIAHYETLYPFPVVACSAVKENGIEQLRTILHQKVAHKYTQIYPQGEPLPHWLRSSTDRIEVS